MNLRDVNATLAKAIGGLTEEVWSGKVKTKWTPPGGFFKQSAREIAKGLKNASDSLEQAMARLNFYVNRAGKNLSRVDKQRLNAAKAELSRMYQ